MNTTTATQVTIAGRAFTVSTVTTSTYLTGPNGALYYLRPFLGADNGDREIIATKNGAALRINGKTIRATHIGDIIEQAVA